MSAEAQDRCACLAIDADPAAEWIHALEGPADVVAPADAPRALAAWAARRPAAALTVLIGPVTLAAGSLERLQRFAGPAVGTVSALPVAHGLPPVAPSGPAGEPPSLPAALPPVVLLTAAGAQLLDAFDREALDAGAWLVAFSEACAARGLLNLLAADVAVVADGARDEGEDGEDPVAVARRRHRRRATGLTVTIDGRSLNTEGSGTQVHVLELIAAVARRVRVRVVMPPDPASSALAALGRVPGLELRGYEDLVVAPTATDVVHRPFQVYDPHDIELLRKLGHRLVVTHQDQLLYRTRVYFADDDAWLNYRDLSRLVLSWAARVVFFTAHARDEALRDGVVDPEQAMVAPIGAERAATLSKEPPRRPDGDWARLGGGPFLLALGTDLAHKNRPFALRLLAALREEHGFAGGLVLAGPHVEPGSSREAEDAAGGDHPVLRLGEVSDAERRWLLEHCEGAVFPSVDEGFGLVPFEAAAAGRPCFFAAVGPAVELLDPELAVLEPWDAAASAANVARLLADPQALAGHVDTLRRVGSSLTWEAAADALVGIYELAADSPPRAVLRATADAAAREQRIRELYEQQVELRASLDADALALVGPAGALPPDLRRPLLAAAARPWSRRPLFAALRALYRLGRGSGA